jgi:hypothetical protein
VASEGYNNSFNQHETERMNMVYEFVLKKFRQKILQEELADLLHMTPTSLAGYLL